MILPRYLKTLFDYRIVKFLILFIFFQLFLINNSIANKKYQQTINIENRLELFIDDYIIESLTGTANRVLHHPIAKEIVIVHDAKWEGSGSGFHNIFKDGEKIKMYYKAWQLLVKADTLIKPHLPFHCYAESRDGINWTKPRIGIIEFNGSKDNNIIFNSTLITGMNIDPSSIFVFKDEKPNINPDETYKAIVRSRKPWGIIPFKSKDGLIFEPIISEVVINDGTFDSQNIVFYDSIINKYRMYYRNQKNSKYDSTFSMRYISTSVSSDFINWEKKEDIIFEDEFEYQLYTNQIIPYYRAPHIYIGFPTRYIERNDSVSLMNLPERDFRKNRQNINNRFGSALTESLLISSRDGISFNKFNEAFLRPGLERVGNWNYGDNMLACGIVETKSDIEGCPNEISIFAVESYWSGNSSSLRRFTLRIDGFVSIYAPMIGGEITTKLLSFDGNKLVLNFSTSAAGSILVELLDSNDNAIPEYSFSNCDLIFGDSIERVITWNGNSDLSKIKSKSIKLKIALRDADLFSFQFKN